MNRIRGRTGRLHRSLAWGFPTPSSNPVFSVNCWGSRFCAECRALSWAHPQRDLYHVHSLEFIQKVQLLCVCSLVPPIEPVDRANQFFKAFKFIIITITIGFRKAKPSCCRESEPIRFLVPQEKLPWQQEEGKKEDSREGLVKGLYALSIPSTPYLISQALYFSSTHSQPLCYMPYRDNPTSFGPMFISWAPRRIESEVQFMVILYPWDILSSGESLEPAPNWTGL